MTNINENNQVMKSLELSTPQETGISQLHKFVGNLKEEANNVTLKALLINALGVMEEAFDNGLYEGQTGGMKQLDSMNLEAYQTLCKGIGYKPRQDMSEHSSKRQFG